MIVRRVFVLLIMQTALVVPEFMVGSATAIGAATYNIQNSPNAIVAGNTAAIGASSRTQSRESIGDRTAIFWCKFVLYFAILILGGSVYSNMTDRELVILQMKLKMVERQGLALKNIPEIGIVQS